MIKFLQKNNRNKMTICTFFLLIQVSYFRKYFGDFEKMAGRFGRYRKCLVNTRCFSFHFPDRHQTPRVPSVSRQCPSDCITVTVWRRTARHRHGGINDVLWLVFVSGADLVSHLKHVLFLPPALTQGYSTVRILLSGHSVLRKDKQNRTSATDISFLPCGWSW